MDADPAVQTEKPPMPVHFESLLPRITGKRFYGGKTLPHLHLRRRRAPRMRFTPTAAPLAHGDATVVAIGQATATDIFPLQITNSAPSTFRIGTTIVTWKAVDANGNTTTGDQRVTTKEVAITVDIDPDTLNLGSNGNSVTVYFELPVGYDVNQVNVGSVTLSNGATTLSVLAKPTAVGDHDADGIPDRMVKFDRSQLEAALASNGGQTVTMTVHGALNNGKTFIGADTIRVIPPASQTPPKAK